MYGAIDFNRKQKVRGEEVDDESGNRLLTMKVDSTQTSSLQTAPQDEFTLGHLLP